MSGLVGRALAGAVGGAAGTLAMDALWYARYRRGGGSDRFVAWETAAGTTGYADAAAPAQVAKKAIETLTGSPPPDSTARAATNAVHWTTGIQWGALYGLAAPLVARRGPVVGGVGLALAAWGTSYTVLPLLGVYKPIWEYDARTLAQDLSAHLVFGVTTTTAARALGA